MRSAISWPACVEEICLETILAAPTRRERLSGVQSSWNSDRRQPAGGRRQHSADCAEQQYDQRDGSKQDGSPIHQVASGTVSIWLCRPKDPPLSDDDGSAMHLTGRRRRPTTLAMWSRARERGSQSAKHGMSTPLQASVRVARSCGQRCVDIAAPVGTEVSGLNLSGRP